MKSVLLLLYSGTMIHAPQQELLPQLAGDIVPKILHHYATGKPEVSMLGIFHSAASTTLGLA